MAEETTQTPAAPVPVPMTPEQMLQMIQQIQQAQSPIVQSPGMPSMSSGWGQPVAATPQSWDTVGVPVVIDSGEKGDVTVYLNFSGLTTPADISACVKGLIAQGVPVKAWKKKGGKW